MRSAKLALQRPMSPAERPADCPPDDRIEHSESWFDFYRVAHDAATGIVQQGALVPPDTVPPTGRGLAEATAFRQRDQLNSVTVDWDDSEEQLPTDWNAYAPRLGVERRTARRVGQTDERRELSVDATDGRHRSPHL